MSFRRTVVVFAVMAAASLLAGVARADSPNAEATQPITASPEATPGPCVPGETCPEWTDSDTDGFLDYEEEAYGSDPNDPASSPETASFPWTCEDGADNDTDGSTDGDDDGCDFHCTPDDPPPGDPAPEDPNSPPGIPYPCDEDTDGDGYFDSEETLWGSDLNDPRSTPESWAHANCEDTIDNDLDGSIDAGDDACGDPCEMSPPGVLVSGPDGQPGMPPVFCDEDTDGDAYYDSEENSAGSDPNDPSSTPEVFWYPESCDDGQDNDKDGQADEDDDLCLLFCIYPEPVPPAWEDPNGEPGGVMPPSGCSIDADGDGVDDFTEEQFGSDPTDSASAPEHLYYSDTCSDDSDNDVDGAVDEVDMGCLPDSDGDTVPDADDNCSALFNPDQSDVDNDGIGDPCEDSDGDGFFDNDEHILGSDPTNASSTPEVFWFSSCEDDADNDLDGAIDLDDGGCEYPRPMPGDPEGSPNGDNDCSGAIEPVDALLILRFDAGLSVTTGGCPGLGAAVPAGETAFVWGDVDCSGAVEPVDALKILRFDAGLDAVQTSWCPRIGD